MGQKHKSLHSIHFVACASFLKSGKIKYFPSSNPLIGTDKPDNKLYRFAARPHQGLKNNSPLEEPVTFLRHLVANLWRTDVNREKRAIDSLPRSGFQEPHCGNLGLEENSQKMVSFSLVSNQDWPGPFSPFPFSSSLTALNPLSSGRSFALIFRALPYPANPLTWVPHNHRQPTSLHGSPPPCSTSIQDTPPLGRPMGGVTTPPCWRVAPPLAAPPLPSGPRTPADFGPSLHGSALALLFSAAVRARAPECSALVSGEIWTRRGWRWAVGA